MLSIFQLPLSDVRSFLDCNTGKLSHPYWPLPEANKNFVRQFGIVKYRYLGGLLEFNESEYCQASNAIRINNSFGTIDNIKNGFERHKAIFRRLYSDGVNAARLELGFKSDKQQFFDFDWIHHIESIALTKFTVGQNHQDFGRVVPLLESGSELANLLLRSTTKSDYPNRNTKSWWISSGEPLLVLTYDMDKYPQPPRSAGRVSVNQNWLAISFQKIYLRKNKLNVWYIGHRFGNKSNDSKKALVRNIRLYILRFHNEQESLKSVLRKLANNSIKFTPHTQNGDHLQRYLHNILNVIFKSSERTKVERSLINITRKMYDLVSPNERDLVLKQLENARREVVRRVELHTTIDAVDKKQITLLNHGQIYLANEIRQEGGTMTNFDIKFGDNTVVQGDFVVAQSIQDSFNKVSETEESSELKDLLMELTQCVAKLIENSSGLKAQEISSDMKILIDEAVKEKPRKGYVQLSAQGIMDAAKSFGEAAVPVINVVEKVMSLLL